MTVGIQPTLVVALRYLSDRESALKRHVLAGVIAAVALLAVLAGAGAAGAQTVTHTQGNIRTLE